MSFRKLIFEDFGTHLDQNPVQSTLFRSFWCPTGTFSESFGFFSRCTISTFSFKDQIIMFWKSILQGALCRNYNFWAFWCSTEHFLTLLESSPGAQYQHFRFNIAWGTNIKNIKITFLHLTDPIKTKENLNLFHF